jgi:glycosyltransferase involved in cell wall biosynthesis
MNLQVSVVIPTYNSADYLPDAIDSALNQTVPPLEVIVVDDGSTDETAGILERYRGRIIVISQENRGPSAARNRGIAAARGDLIAFLDADDVWLPRKLEKQLACLAEHPRAGLVHTDVLMLVGDKIEGHPPTPYRAEKVGHCYHRYFWHSGGTPSAILIRRECLAQVGGFDEALRRAAAEDYDFCFRFARHYELAYVDEPLFLHRDHASNSSKRALPMSEDTLYVVRKALEADPHLRRVVGRRMINDRLFPLYFDIGYQHQVAGRSAEARRYFLGALRHRPFSGRTWFLYLANFLPPTWVRWLRSLKSPLGTVGGRRTCEP